MVGKKMRNLFGKQHMVVHQNFMIQKHSDSKALKMLLIWLAVSSTRLVSHGELVHLNQRC